MLHYWKRGVEAIWDHHYKLRLGKHTLEYLVKWAGCDKLGSTWELKENLGNAKEIISKYHQHSNLLLL